MKAIQLKAMLLAFAGILFFTTQSFSQGVYVMNNTGVSLQMGVEIGDGATCVQSAGFSGIVPPGGPHQIDPVTADVLWAAIYVDPAACSTTSPSIVRGACLGGTSTTGSAPCLPSFTGSIFGSFLIVN